MQLALAYIPCPNIQEAKSLAKKSIEAKLAACANIVPEVSSVYLDQGKVVDSTESILLIKHKISDFPLLRKLILENHSYDIPCVTQINLLNTNQEYLSWVEQTLN